MYMSFESELVLIPSAPKTCIFSGIVITQYHNQSEFSLVNDQCMDNSIIDYVYIFHIDVRK